MNLLVLAIGFFYIAKNQFKLPKIAIYSWVPLLLASFVSVSYSVEPATTLRSSFVLLTNFMIFVIPVYLIKDKIMFNRAMSVIIFSSFIPIVYAFIELFIIGPENGINGLRVKSTFSHPNMFGFFILVCFGCYLFLSQAEFFEYRYRHKFWFKVYPLFLMICLLLTNTRSAWIGVVFIFTIYAVFCERKYLFYLFVVALVALQIPAIKERVDNLQSGNSVENYQQERLNSFAWRKLLWSSSMDMIAQRPFIGYGTKTFAHYMPDFFPLPTKQNFDAHNVYVEILFGLGIIGLLFYLNIFILVILRLKKAYRYDKKASVAVLSLVLSYMLVSFSDNMLDYLVVNWYFWFFIGCIIAWLINCNHPCNNQCHE